MARALPKHVAALASLAGLSSKPRRPNLRQCPMCGAWLSQPETKLCARCLAERRTPTPLRRYVHATGVTLSQVRRDAGVSQRTIMRAAAGEPLARSIAGRIARVTGLDAETLRAGVERTRAIVEAARKDGTG